MKKHIFTLLLSIFIFHALIFSQQTHVITQTGFTFDPASITVNVGDTIVWVWTGGTHTTTSTTVPDGADEWNSPLSFETTEFKYKVFVAGTYDYHCIPHQSMGMTGSFTALPLLGIDVYDYQDISVYPNPVKDVVYVNGISSKNIILQVYNIAGVLLHEEESGKLHSLDVEKYTSGLYILRIYEPDSGDIHITKFFKE